ncbi:MAG TPA: sodium:solute symporter [Verrucomicrobiota bacterium]|nr:sodium:solute symporter [Verrucomicrobiota bacterium]
MNSLPVIDIAVLILYLAGIVGVGMWFGRKGQNTEKFTAANRRVPGWAVGLSILGTYVSSISFLALPGKAFASNWNVFVFSLALPLAAWIAVRYFVPFYRKEGSVSAYQHLEQRFGPWARTYAVACYLLTQLARMGVILYLLALALEPLTGWSKVTIILVTGLLVIVYTFVGGIEAVIWTDVIQSVVFIVGAGACIVVLLNGFDGGPGRLFQIASEQDKFSLGSFGPELGEATFWVVLLNGIFINLQNFGIDQSYVQRYQTAKTDRDAGWSVWVGALFYIPISAVFLFIGTALFAFYTEKPELLPPAVDAVGKPDSVFPHFISEQLPVGLAGLVIASIFAAAQSTISTSVNGSATLVLCDIYRRYFRPGASEEQSLRVLRVATVVAGLAGIGAALAMLRIRSALDTWWSLASIFSGGMLGLFLLGLVSRRTGSRAAAAGVVTGVLLIAWMTFSPGWTGTLEAWRSPFHAFLIVVVSTVTILIVGLLASLVTRSARR